MTKKTASFLTCFSCALLAAYSQDQDEMTIRLAIRSGVVFSETRQNPIPNNGSFNVDIKIDEFLLNLYPLPHPIKGYDIKCLSLSSSRDHTNLSTKNMINYAIALLNSNTVHTLSLFIPKILFPFYKIENRNTLEKLFFTDLSLGKLSNVDLGDNLKEITWTFTPRYSYGNPQRPKNEYAFQLFFGDGFPHVEHLTIRTSESFIPPLHLSNFPSLKTIDLPPVEDIHLTTIDCPQYRPTFPDA